MYIQLIEIAMLLLLSLVSDIKIYKIKNFITFPIIGLGLITNFFLEGFLGLSNSLAACLLPLPVLMILYMTSMLGAGDIKLFCAIGSVMGIDFIIYCMIFSFLCGGIIALTLMIIRKNARQRLSYLFGYIKTCLSTYSFHPYTAFEDKDDGAKFHFSYAIVFGAIISLIVLQYT
jgi:prepilin peptidase CpaA